MRTTSRTRRSAAALAAAALLLVGACTGGEGQPGYGTGGNPTTSAPTPTDTASPTDDAAPSGTASPGTADPDDDTGDDTSTDEPTGSAPPFAANTEPDTAEPGGDARLTVTDVRVGAHDGFDRVVFDLGGSGTPGWRVEYVDEAVDDGSGNPVDVDGDAILQVVISGTAMPDDSGVPEYDGGPVDPDGTEAVEEVVYRFWFEGYSTAFIGVDGERRPFRVFALSDPARVVVDVRHD
ncbi:hypothetical protein [Isoptericola variabilis]|uniref:AMIN-like domain-containing protein n=1 Tax=Isoptericola variabilis (strain 225) TaxID=743718 RepID=F6FQ26_ISOV2|nr:hypothetical protein [Isoptericola variabilis]AEG44832.1 hypothetical protein Isova_2103 [Isoptericola variabilis 225]TWH31646.1 hypothetical protein L600_002200000380 [Isoptericola variabilis J7]